MSDPTSVAAPLDTAVTGGAASGTEAATLPPASDAPASTRRGRRPRPPWVKLTDEQLLDVRMSDLGVTVEGSVLEGRVAQLYEELAERGIRFQPHVWLSEDWFTPDDVPGVAIPFYLAHPRLARLEQNQMFEVEGGIFARWPLRPLRGCASSLMLVSFQTHLPTKLSAGRWWRR
jgi:hypothetical protein